MWFQYDGIPAHFGEIVRKHLNATYGQTLDWTRRANVMTSKVGDLRPLDFYFWGRKKDLVFIAYAK